MIDLSKIKESPIIMVSIVAAAIVIVIATIVMMTENVVLQIQVLDAYDQPVVNKKLLIQGLEKDPITITTDGDGIAMHQTKIFRKEKSFSVSVSTKDYPNYTKDFLLVKGSDIIKRFQIRLGIETVPVKVTVKPPNANYTLSRISNGEVITHGDGHTATLLELPPDNAYKLEVSLNTMYRDTIFYVGKDGTNIVLEISDSTEVPPDTTDKPKINLTININPSTGNWKLTKRPNKKIDEDKGDKTIKIDQGRYELTGWRPGSNISKSISFSVNHDTSVTIDVREKYREGKITINVIPENVGWEIINLTNKKMFTRGKGSKNVNKIPLGKYQIKYIYESVSKISEIIVLIPIQSKHEASISFEGLEDKIGKCLSNNDYECAVRQYEQCVQDDCNIPCDVYDMIGDAYLKEGFVEEGLEVFEKGYDSLCNLNNHKFYLNKYVTSLYRYSTDYDKIDKVSGELLKIAQAEANYTLEGGTLIIRYVNTYNIIKENPRSEESCPLFERCEEDVKRIHWLNNILDQELPDVSTYESAIKTIKIQSPCP